MAPCIGAVRRRAGLRLLLGSPVWGAVRRQAGLRGRSGWGQGKARRPPSPDRTSIQWPHSKTTQSKTG